MSESTNPVEAMEALKSKMGHKAPRRSRLALCGACGDTGWEELDPTDRGVVKRCRYGCEPPRREKRKAQPEKSGAESFS